MFDVIKRYKTGVELFDLVSELWLLVSDVVKEFI